jgi:Ferredoxin thioredoxin reductase variable alpha chain
MKLGDRVKVKQSVVVYHHPEHRGQPFDISSQEGEITAIVTEWEGKTISANFPYLVQFTKKFRAHLRVDEIELV